MVISGAFIAGYLAARFFGDSIKKIVDHVYAEVSEWL